MMTEDPSQRFATHSGHSACLPGSGAASRNPPAGAAGRLEGSLFFPHRSDRTGRVPAAPQSMGRMSPVRGRRQCPAAGIPAAGRARSLGFGEHQGGVAPLVDAENPHRRLDALVTPSGLMPRSRAISLVSIWRLTMRKIRAGPRSVWRRDHPSDAKEQSEPHQRNGLVSNLSRIYGKSCYCTQGDSLRAASR